MSSGRARPLKASSDNLRPSTDFSLDASLQRPVLRLSAAVKSPTESFDDNGDVDEIRGGEHLMAFHDTLKDLFPLIHDRAKLEKAS